MIHEDSIKVDGVTKAPDYSFRIGGVRKFFVETKKPSVNIHQDAISAYQLRRYAWSATLPLSILTDFEEFAVYDCRIRPEKNDKASKGRTLYLKYDRFDARWGEIASIFSRDAILKGSFDKYVESTKRKRGTAEVDEWTLSLRIDDRVLKEIIRRLYYPESPHEFSVLGADILGQVYEQFLGKVIRLTKGHQAKVEDKPEVKKAGGVYYIRQLTSSITLSSEPWASCWKEKSHTRSPVERKLPGSLPSEDGRSRCSTRPVAAGRS